MVLTVLNDELIGAAGVDVNGVSYDVEFKEGTFTEVFGSASGLDVTSSAEASAFSSALLGQVFIDGAEGLFDIDPVSTFGCIYNNLCWVYTPYNVDNDTLDVHRAINAVAEVPAGRRTPGDETSALTTTISFDSAHTGPTGSKALWADWSVSTVGSEVPVPGAVWLFASALLGLFSINRKIELRFIC